MSLEGIVVSSIMAGVFLLWLMLPFIYHKAEAPIDAPVTRQRERLQVYYQRVLRNLHDIDEDYATGKLSEAEYIPEREAWVQRGIQTLKALDELNEEHLIAPEEADDAAIDEIIEQVLHKG